MKEHVEVETKYDKKGYITDISINGVPYKLSEIGHPVVAMLQPNVDWVIEKVYMTPEEIKTRYPHYNN